MNANLTNETLDAILEAHVEWVVSDHRNGRQANLSACQLQDVDLAGRNLSYVSLKGADLAGKDLSRTVLDRADLTGANLTGAKLTGAKCRSTKLQNAILDRIEATQADFFGANLSGMQAKGADFEKCNFSYAILNDARIIGSAAVSANFQYAKLMHTAIQSSNLLCADFFHADFQKAVLEKNHLQDTIFQRSTVTDCRLTQNDFSHSDFEYSDFSGSSLATNRLVSAKTFGMQGDLLVPGYAFDRDRNTMTYNVDRDELSHPDLRQPVSLDAFLKTSIYQKNAMLHIPVDCFRGTAEYLLWKRNLKNVLKAYRTKDCMIAASQKKRRVSDSPETRRALHFLETDDRDGAIRFLRKFKEQYPAADFKKPGCELQAVFQQELRHAAMHSATR